MKRSWSNACPKICFSHGPIPIHTDNVMISRRVRREGQIFFPLRREDPVKMFPIEGTAMKKRPALSRTLTDVYDDFRLVVHE